MPLGSSSAAPEMTPGPSSSTDQLSLWVSVAARASATIGSAMGMVQLEPLAQPIGGEIAGGVAGETQRLGDGCAKQRIAERIQDKRERALGNMMLLMTDSELRYQRAEGVEDRIERVPIAGEDHPGGERAGAFLAERVE